MLKLVIFAKKMKQKNIVIFIIIFFIFLSCKRYDTIQNGNVEVILDFVMKNDNDLVLYYKDGTNEWFLDEKSVGIAVKGSKDIQQVTFKIDLKTLPNDYRLDIGRNYFVGQDTVQIKKFVLKYYDNKFLIPEGEFGKYFKGNEYIRYDEKSKAYILNKNKDGLYDPFFETTMDFYPELLKLIN